MTECDEIAEGMVDGYRVWLENTNRSANMDTSRIYVSSQMATDESPVFIDNVAWSLWSAVVKPQIKIDLIPPTYADAGSW
jgi:hypothetical protein